MSKKQRQREVPNYDPVGEPTGMETVNTETPAEPSVIMIDPNPALYGFVPQPQQTMTRIGPKLLIAIPTCEEDKALEDACRATWAKHREDVDIVFFGEMLGVADEYERLPIKIQAICRLALEREYDFMLRVDTDTFVWVDRILASGFEAHDYSGWTGGKAAPKDEYASGGAGYWLSKKAMEIVANSALTNDTCEDRWVGRVLYDAGIIVHRNVNHAHGRHEEVTPELLTMHPCRSLEWMKKMEEA